jgi:hypothetical protein
MQLKLTFPPLQPLKPRNQLSLRFEREWEFCLPDIRAELVNKLQTSESRDALSGCSPALEPRTPLTAKQATVFAKQFMKEKVIK